MPIGDWMGTLKAMMLQVEGIEQVHTYEDLPGAIGSMPAMIILPLEGTFDYGEGGPNDAHHEIQATLYVASQLLPQGYGTAVPLIDLVRDKLASSITLNQSVAHCLPSSAAPFYDGPGGILYAGEMYLGIIFRFTVKEPSGSYNAAA